MCTKIKKSKEQLILIYKVNNEMIKNSVTILYPVYHKLCNLILQSGIYPMPGCEGSITPIFKSGTRSDPNNYSGICVSSCIGKFFCSIINQRILSYIQETTSYTNHKLVFYPIKEHLIIYLLYVVLETDRSGWKVYACFIDFKKAFDSVWHQDMLFKLLQNKNWRKGVWYDQKYVL